MTTDIATIKQSVNAKLISLPLNDVVSVNHETELGDKPLTKKLFKSMLLRIRALEEQEHRFRIETGVVTPDISEDPSDPPGYATIMYERAYNQEPIITNLSIVYDDKYSSLITLPLNNVMFDEHIIDSTGKYLGMRVRCYGFWFGDSTGAGGDVQRKAVTITAGVGTATWTPAFSATPIIMGVAPVISADKDEYKGMPNIAIRTNIAASTVFHVTYYDDDTLRFENWAGTIHATAGLETVSGAVTLHAYDLQAGAARIAYTVIIENTLE